VGGVDDHVQSVFGLGPRVEEAVGHELADHERGLVEIRRRQQVAEGIANQTPGEL
jgi:hypothetical protein